MKDNEIYSFKVKMEFLAQLGREIDIRGKLKKSVPFTTFATYRSQGGLSGLKPLLAIKFH